MIHILQSVALDGKGAILDDPFAFPESTAVQYPDELEDVQSRLLAPGDDPRPMDPALTDLVSPENHKARADGSIEVMDPTDVNPNGIMATTVPKEVLAALDASGAEEENDTGVLFDLLHAFLTLVTEPDDNRVGHLAAALGVSKEDLDKALFRVLASITDDSPGHLTKMHEDAIEDQVNRGNDAAQAITISL